ncbi:Rnf-Nqr domain containing protein [Spirochaetia bacterium 38H-sp]|uniref:Rnf-Nqr domain containing protein n=1 Tax=Rarispira pelagica TaxID=3141764 RepID=A0ABU9UAD0_9SPIR
MSFFIFSVFYNPVFYFFLGASLVIFAPSSIRDALKLGFFTMVLLFFAGSFQFVMETFWLDVTGMLAFRLIVFFVGFSVILLAAFYLGKSFFPKLMECFYDFIRDGSIISLVLGLVFIIMDQRMSFLQSVFAFFSAGIGFLIALLAFVGISNSIRDKVVPTSMQGLPVRILSAGLVSMFFMAVGEAFLYNF